MELVELTGRNPDEYDIARARQLFARVLDVPGRRQNPDDPRLLPIAAEPLPARSRRAAGIRRARRARRRRGAGRGGRSRRQRGARRASETPNGLAEALAVVARHAPEERFTELMADIAARARQIARRARRWRDRAAAAALHGRSRCRTTTTGDGLIAAFCADGACDEAGLRAAAAALADGIGQRPEARRDPGPLVRGAGGARRDARRVSRRCS